MDRPQFYAALEEIFVADKGSITDDTTVEQLGKIDSMALLEIQALADEEFNTQVEPDDVKACLTVAALRQLMKLD